MIRKAIIPLPQKRKRKECKKKRKGIKKRKKNQKMSLIILQIILKLSVYEAE